MAAHILTITALVHRTPDASDEIVVSNPGLRPEHTEVNLRTIYLDDGADYDGWPYSKDECEAARSRMRALRRRIARLPADDPVRIYAEGWLVSMAAAVKRAGSAARGGAEMSGTHFLASWYPTDGAYAGRKPACFDTRADAVDYLCKELERVAQRIAEETGEGGQNSADSAIAELRNGADQVDCDESVYWFVETAEDCPEYFGRTCGYGVIGADIRDVRRCDAPAVATRTVQGPQGPETYGLCAEHSQEPNA